MIKLRLDIKKLEIKCIDCSKTVYGYYYIRNRVLLCNAVKKVFILTPDGLICLKCHTKEQKIIQDMVTAITPELWTLFLQMIVTVVFTLVIYQVLRNVASYINLRFDKEFGKNVKVIYDGKNAYVKDITLKHLILRLENGNDLLVPISKVMQMHWEIERKGRRKTDRATDRATEGK